MGLESNHPSRHGLKQFDWFSTELEESLLDSVDSVPNWSPNRFEGRFESVNYLIGQFDELVSTRVEPKNIDSNYPQSF